MSLRETKIRRSECIFVVFSQGELVRVVNFVEYLIRDWIDWFSCGGVEVWWFVFHVGSETSMVCVCVYAKVPLSL